MHGEDAPRETGGRQPMETAVPEQLEHAVSPAPRDREEIVRDAKSEGEDDD